jgi:hypothetical protein
VTTNVPQLSMGMVSQATGIPADTIRTWERRYCVVTPTRDTRGRRLYSAAQVERLRTIAALAERGDRVADIADLSQEILGRRLAMSLRPTEQVHVGEIAVCLVHPTWSGTLDGPVSAGTVRVVQTTRDAEAVTATTVPVQVLVADLDLLGNEPVAALRKLRKKLSPEKVVITYHFASRGTLEPLEADRTIKGSRPPLEVRELLGGLATPRLVDSPSDVAPRVFSDSQLEQLLNIRSRIQCECPNHLAGLVIAMQAFERYSEGCESEGEQNTGLHAGLTVESGAIRGRLEAMLIQVCEDDGIDWKRLG